MTNLCSESLAGLSLSTGCGHAGRTGVFTLLQKDGNHVSRSFLLQVPAPYNPNQPYALTFIFHGSGGSSEDTFNWGLQNAPGAYASSIFVFPQGIRYQSGDVGWDNSEKGYDMPFFDNMVRQLESEYCIDTTRIFVAGFSWGGDFVISLACHRGNVIRAVAVNSATDNFSDTSNYLTYNYLPCSASTLPAIRFEHAEVGDGSYEAPAFATTSKLFQHLNQCSAASTPLPTASSVSACVSYNGCKQQFIECSFDHGIGHSKPPRWGLDTWKFFSSIKPIRRP